MSNHFPICVQAQLCCFVLIIVLSTRTYRVYSYACFCCCCRLGSTSVGAYSSWYFVDFRFWQFLCIFQAHAINTWRLLHAPDDTAFQHSISNWIRLAVKCEMRRNCSCKLKQAAKRERERERKLMWTYAECDPQAKTTGNSEHDVSWAHKAGCNPQVSLYNKN